MKKFLSVLLVLVMCFGSVAFAEGEEVPVEEEPEYIDWYDVVPYGYMINDAKEYIKGEDSAPEALNFLAMFKMDYGEEALADVGFTICDITGDTEPELIFVRINDRTDGVCTGSNVIAVFTVEGMLPLQVFVASPRDRYNILPDAKIYNEGSYSAYAGGSAVYTLNREEHGFSFKLIECYEYEYNDQGVATYYHTGVNENGERVTKKVTMTSTEYNQAASGLAADTVTLTLTPVTDYVLPE